MTNFVLSAAIIEFDVRPQSYDDNDDDNGSDDDDVDNADDDNE